jgi:hypothetical protein
VSILRPDGHRLFRLLSVALAILSSITVEARTASEREIKSAFLYHFAKFVDWPDDPVGNDRFVMCVLQDAEFAEALKEQTAGKTVRDKSIEVVLLQDHSQVASCRIFYVGAPSPAAAHSTQPPRGTLLVTDGALGSTAAIAFVPRGNNVGFEIDVSHARDAGLAISSQLLKLAVHVAGVPPDLE